MTVELIGAPKAEADLLGIAERLAHPSTVLHHELRVLEAAERGTFAGLGGRYVATGATLRSLTLPVAPHAIRRITAGGTLEFGTDVGYARYLTEDIGPPTPAGGASRPLPVAVLKLTLATREQVAHDVMDHIAGESGTHGIAESFLGGML